MIRDITIGQYYPAQSRIHMRDPRVKIVCTLLFLVSLFIQNSPSRVCCGDSVSRMCDPVFKVPLKFIVKD